MTTQQQAILAANLHLMEAVTYHDENSPAGVSWHLWQAALSMIEAEPRTPDPELEAALNSL
jgi:hypothetical protein